MKTYYFKDLDNQEFSVQANNIKEATVKANAIAAKTTGNKGWFGQAFFTGTVVDNDIDEIYSRGIRFGLSKDSE